MVENPKEWPRVHTCLGNWCPEPNDNCKRCDAVLEVLSKQRCRCCGASSHTRLECPFYKV